MSTMDGRTRIRYDLEVMSAFRFPIRTPVNDFDEVSDDEIDTVREARQEFVKDKLEDMDDWVTDLIHSRSDQDQEEEWVEPPDPLEMELRWVGDQLASLEAYRDRLIVFARSFASDSVPVRTIGQHTRLSHSTVVRMITEEAIANIAGVVGPIAHRYLEGDFDPRDDPEFYRRLRAAVSADPRADQ
jgi:hypothetical protein